MKATMISKARCGYPVSRMRLLPFPPSGMALLRCDGRLAALAAGRRRAVRTLVTRAALSSQGPYPPGAVPGMPGPRRYGRPPRDLQQLADILSAGAADDPEQFLQLLSSSPRVLERRRVSSLMGDQSTAAASRSVVEQDALQVQEQQQQQKQQQLQAAAAAAAAVEARRRAQQEQEEERQRKEALRAAMLRNARRHLPQYDASSLARLASGLAAAGIHDPALCDEMLRQLVDQQPLQQTRKVVSEPRSLAELLDAFAAMRHRPTDAQITELLRLQQREQQQAAEQESLRRLQAQQLLKSQPRLQPRGMVVPEPKPPTPAPVSTGATDEGTSAGRMSPEDAARLLYALSRLGYSPDEGTLTQLLDQLQPQRLHLQPTPLNIALPPSRGRAAPYGRSLAAGWPEQQQLRKREGRRWAAAPVQQQLPSQARQAAVELEAVVLGDAEEQEQEDDQESQDLQDELSYSLQGDAQAVGSAVRALERMGRPDKAQQLRDRFTRHVREVQARVARERELRRQQQEAAAVAAERDRERKEAAVAALRERQQQSEPHWRQRQEEQACALRQQLARQLRAADQWQQIRALLFTYQEALDANCLAAAAARLAELLGAARRTGRGLAMTLRERGELGDLLEGLGQLVLRNLDGVSAAQAASLLTSVVRMRHLEEALLVGLLRRVRDTLDQAGGAELSSVLYALAECGVRPSRPWVETFLNRCEDLLEQVSPEDLAGLPVALAQLGAHPGRSWLGSYLDVLQDREGELSQSLVSEAVRAVALLDRSFLSAWRQAAAVRQQQQQQQARAAAAAAATAEAAQQQQKLQEEQRRLQQQPALEQHQHQQRQQASASALASVDEILARETDCEPDRRDRIIPEELLTPMHPKQRAMADQQQAKARAGPVADREAQQPSESVALEAAGQTQTGPKSIPRVSHGLDALTRSIELDVDAANLSHPDEGSASVSTAATPSSAGRTAEVAAPAISSPTRQLPGSFSMDGFYNPEPYDEYGVNWDEGDTKRDLEDVEIGENRDEELSGQECTRPSMDDQVGKQQPAAPEPAGPATAATATNVNSVEPTAATTRESEQHGGLTAKHQAQQPQQVPPTQEPVVQAQVAPEAKTSQQQPTADEQNTKQPTPEDLAQARALRSLLLERYEAVVAYKEEVEEKRRRAAEAEAKREASGGERVISEREVAAAAKVLAVREQLQRLQADFDNIKRRASAEREQSLARIKADILRPLLSVVDNFERAAMQIKPKTDGERAVHEAYQTVCAQLKELLKKEGLDEVGLEGETFDPNQHEAVMREDRDDVEDGTVTGVFQKGYRLGEVLIRPALVKVAYN